MISELPADVKRRVLASTFPSVYECIKKNPIMLEFVRNIILRAPNTHYSSVVLIDFIANNLDVGIVMKINEWMKTMFYYYL